MPKKVVLIFIFALLFVSCSGRPAFAWPVSVHKQIVLETIRFMPPDMQQFFAKYQSSLLRGIEAREVELKGADEQDATVVMVQHQADKITQMLLEGGSEGEIAYEFGILARYLTDLSDPAYAIGPSGEELIKIAYENDLEKHTDGLGSVFNGFQLNIGPGEMARKTALWSRQYYSVISSAYLSGEDYRSIAVIACRTYSQAVNDLVEAWLKIWKDAGRLQALDPSAGVRVKVNNREITFDEPPFVVNGRTMVPLRPIFEAMGAVVQWIPDSETAIATKGGVNIQLQVGNAMAKNGDTAVWLDEPPYIKGKRVMVPLRFVVEAFRGEVAWDGLNQTVYITTPDAFEQIAARLK